MLRSPLGRRMIALFAGCALVPIGALALLSIWSVSQRLQEEADTVLHREVKVAGMSLVQRLNTLEVDLRIVAESLQSHTPSSDVEVLDTSSREHLERRIRELAVDSLPAAVRQRMDARFVAIGVRPAESEAVHPILGELPARAAELAKPAVDHDHVLAGRTLLRYLSGPELLQMACRVSPDSAAHGMLVGYVAPPTLWELEGVRPVDGALFVLDQHGHLLLSTRESPPAADVLATLVGGGTSSGSLTWTGSRRAAGRDVTYTGRYRRLFLEPRYAAQWLVVHGRDVAAVHAPLNGFRMLFALLTLLTFLAVVWLGLVHIRQLLEPIARLETATRRVAAGDLDARVDLRRDDELGELARSFDRMTARLAESERALIEARDDALAAVRAENTFLTNVSHEFRTPLTGIVSSAEILHDYADGDPDTQREFTEVILDQARVLARLLDDVLALNGIGSTEVPAPLQPVALEPTLQAATERLPAAARTRVRIHLAHDLPPLCGDAAQLEQLWFQLLDNAIKFSPEHEAVAVRARRAGPAVVVKIVDHGVGIAREYQELIFERFRQVGRDIMTDKATGTGLGLALAKSIVERHGGTITVQSEFGTGATFLVTLPVAATAAVAGPDPG